MSDQSVGTEPVPADAESPPSDALSRSDKESRDNGARMTALIVGVLVGMGMGIFIGMGIGNAARKRIDRWSPRY